MLVIGQAGAVDALPASDIKDGGVAVDGQQHHRIGTDLHEDQEGKEGRVHVQKPAGDALGGHARPRSRVSARLACPSASVWVEARP